MEQSELKKWMSVVMNDNGLSNRGIYKGPVGKVIEPYSPLGFVTVNFGMGNREIHPSRLKSIEEYDLYTPKEIDKKIEEPTMNEKKASEYCHENETDERIKKLERTVKVLEKDLEKDWEKLEKHEERIEILEEHHTWNDEECHDPIPELTDLEREILKAVEDNFEWVAKGFDEVQVFERKPEKNCKDDYYFWDAGGRVEHIKAEYPNTFDDFPRNRPFKIADLIKEG